jgi:small conductance mechanosensitive channel
MKDLILAEWIPYLSATGILLLTFLVGFLFNRFTRSYIKKSALILDNDPTNYQFLRRALAIVIYLIGFSLAVYAIPSLRTLAKSLLAGAGIAAVAIGFASQAALSNIIAGVFIVIFKPFRVKDRVTVKDTITGIIEDITLRHTVIRNFQNRRVIIPNSMISEEIIVNADIIESKICKWIEIGISYGSDIDLARAIMADEAQKHPNCLDNRSEEEIAEGAPKVMVRVLALGEYAVTMRAWVWAEDSASGFVMECELLESIKKRFDAEGIEIPFPYRSLVFKNQPEIS